ncbi:MAG: pilus assembly protein PilM [Clostridium sp.]|uniref:pilus assembly protein PilM n=1 Tax=Clostridium sp. TaxID=1506 RepID=UPI003F3FFAD0
MFEKDIIAIDMNEEKISILIGNRYKVIDGITLDMPGGAYADDEIINVEKITGVLAPCIKKSKGKIKEVAFCVRGQNMITRHLVLPYMKEEAMRDSVEFELKQFIGERIEEYYFDYEIINYDKNQNSGNADVLIVAVEKGKVDKLMELAASLKLTVKSVDIYANSTSRIFKNLKTSFIKRVKSAGIITIDGHSNSMIITEWGRLAIEKYQGYGMYGASEEILLNQGEYNKFIDSIDLTEVREEEEKYDRFFQSLVSQYNALIQFYASGKVKKNLDKIFIAGSARQIRGIHQYLEVNFGTKVDELPTFNDFKFNIKAPKKIELEEYMNAYGLLLRKE